MGKALDKEMKTPLHLMLQASRAQRIARSDQWTLGKLIAALEPLAAVELKEGELPAAIEFEFAGCRPIGLASWRGAYEELAISYEAGSNSFGMKMADFLEILKKAVGEVFVGYKGGNFLMDEDTPLWVANDGCVEHTAVVGIKDDGYKVTILTATREY